MFPAIAEALDWKICVTSDKNSVLQCLEDRDLSARVRVGWKHSQLHVVPMNKLNYKVTLRVSVNKIHICLSVKHNTCCILVKYGLLNNFSLSWITKFIGH